MKAVPLPGDAEPESAVLAVSEQVATAMGRSANGLADFARDAVRPGPAAPGRGFGVVAGGGLSQLAEVLRAAVSRFVTTIRVVTAFSVHRRTAARIGTIRSS